MRLPRPPLAVALPALAWLGLETWGCLQALSPGRSLRLAMVACLVVAVLFERPAALTLWMLCSLFGALTWFAQAFHAGGHAPGTAIVCMALAVCALANAGYLLFFHHAPAAGSEGR
jgi:hypothetical protein